LAQLLLFALCFVSHENCIFLSEMMQDMVAAKLFMDCPSYCDHSHFSTISFWNLVYLETQTTNNEHIQTCQYCSSGAGTTTAVDSVVLPVVFFLSNFEEAHSCCKFSNLNYQIDIDFLMRQTGILFKLFRYPGL